MQEATKVMILKHDTFLSKVLLIIKHYILHDNTRYILSTWVFLNNRGTKSFNLQYLLATIKNGNFVSL